MRTRLKRIFGVSIGAVTLLTGVIVSTFFLSSPAQGKSNSLISKAIGYQVYECYQSTVGMRNEVTMQQYDGLDSITAIGHLANLPYGYYGDLTNTTCAKLIGGVPEEGFSGAVALKGVTIPSDNKNTAAVSEFLTNMGYIEKKGDQEGLCANYTYTLNRDNSTYVVTMCNTTDKDGYITGDRFQIYDKNGNSSIPYSSTIVQFEAQNRAIRLDCSSVVGYGKCEKHTFEPGDKFETFAGEILGDLQEHRASVPWGTPNAIGVRPYAWTLSGMKIEPFGDTTSSFSFDNPATAGKKAVEFLTGYGNITDLKLTDSEKLELLKDYLTDWYKVDNYGCNLDSSAESIATGAGYQPIRTNIFSGNEYQTCYIKPTAHVGLSVASYGDSGYFDGTMMGFDAIVKNIEGLTNSFIEADRQKCNEAATSARQAAQNLLDQSTTSEEYRQRAQNTINSIKQIEDSYGQYWYESDGNIGCYKFVGLDGEIVDTEITPPTQDDDFESPDEGGTDISCSSDVPSLGWVICPTLQLMGNAADGMYQEIENDWLAVNASDVKAEKGTPVYDGWEFFRNFANIIFAIALVVVILSQVTGIGVSNYGIKKILPSLIIVAVLVNLSFFICQVCVDLSNIIGVGIKDILENEIGISSTGPNGFNFRETLGSSLVSVGLVAAVAGGVTWGANHPEIWVVPLLCVILVSVVSTLFFFIILAVRKAGIYILIMLAPVAIVCYALPNTKRLFERWKKLFTGLLVVYPICGLLMGGGNFAGKLVANMDSLNSEDGGSFIMQLVAMLLQVVPFFFIPTVLRSSLNAIGQLGVRLTNFGSRVGNTLSGGIKRSETTRRFNTAAGALGADYGSKVHSFWRNNRLTGGVFRRFDNTGLGQTLSRGRATRDAQARAAYNAAQQKDLDARWIDETARPGTETYRRLEASSQIKYRNDQIQQREDALRRNPNFNNDDLGSLETELESAVKAVNDNPADERAEFNLAAIANFALRKGKPGEDMVSRVYNKELYRGSPNRSQGTRSAAINALTSHINYNEKFRSSIKDHNAAQDAILNAVSGGDDIMPLARYQGTVADKPMDFASGSSLYYKDLLSSLSMGTLDGNSEQLEKAFNASSAALTNPQLSKMLKSGEDITNINKIRTISYQKFHDAYINDGGTEQEFINRYGNKPPDFTNPHK